MAAVGAAGSQVIGPGAPTVPWAAAAGVNCVMGSPLLCRAP